MSTPAPGGASGAAEDFDYARPRAFRDERLAWLDNVARYVAHRGGAVLAAPADAAALADFERETAGGGSAAVRASLPRRARGHGHVHGHAHAEREGDRGGETEDVTFVVLDPRLTAKAEVARALVRGSRPAAGGARPHAPRRVVLVAAEPAARAAALAEARAEAPAVAFEAAAARLFAGPMCDILFPHRVLPPAEAAELADLGALPAIARDDPGAFWAGAAPGDVVEIVAPSDTTLEAPEYRVVR